MPYGWWRSFAAPGLTLVSGGERFLLSGLYAAAAGVAPPAAGSVAYGDFVPWAAPESARAAFVSARVACLSGATYARLQKGRCSAAARAMLAARAKGRFSAAPFALKAKARVGGLEPGARHDLFCALLLGGDPDYVLVDFADWPADEDARAFYKRLRAAMEGGRAVGVAFCADGWARAEPGTALLPGPRDRIPPDAVYTLPSPGADARAKGGARRFFAAAGALAGYAPRRLALWLTTTALLFAGFACLGGADYASLPAVRALPNGGALAAAMPALAPILLAALSFVLGWRAPPPLKS